MVDHSQSYLLVRRDFNVSKSDAVFRPQRMKLHAHMSIWTNFVTNIYIEVLHLQKMKLKIFVSYQIV